MEGENVIEIQNLTKYYGKNRGVTGISFSVEKGDIFGFLGPNGAGKSTTIRSMLGLLEYQDGNIRLLQKDVRKKRDAILSEVGYVPSEAVFYPSMKVKDVITLAAKARKRNCEKEAARIVRLFELDQEKRIEELSLGNRKKVSIVCALQHKPKLLILDEPTSGLDPLMQEIFFELVLEANRKGTTCFLSSHVLSEVKRYCRNAAIIKDGALIKRDTVENLSKSNIRRVKLKTMDEEKEFVYTGNMKELIHKLSRMDICDVLIEELSLDEIFMQYYEEGESHDDHKA